MFLQQYRGDDWPLLGDFAVGLLKRDTTRWFVDGHLGDDLADVELATPWGSLYVWYRRW